MRQFVLPDDWDGGPRAKVRGKRARYLLGVLRLSVGDRFPGVDASGRAWNLEVLESTPTGLVLGVTAARTNQGPLPDIHAGTGTGLIRDPNPSSDAALSAKPLLPRLILVQAVAKGPAMDRIVRYATELGVARIVPILAERSTPDPDSGRLERWRRIVREGLQQSGSRAGTIVDAPSPLADLATRLGPPEGLRVGLFCHEAPLAEASFHRYLGGHIDEVVLCVGPEGGFARQELDFFESLGFRAASLGPSILRAETAALFALAAAEIVILERSTWTANE